jgi:hypothetical protein
MPKSSSPERLWRRRRLSFASTLFTAVLLVVPEVRFGEPSDLRQDLAQWGLSPPQLVMVDEPAYRRFHRGSEELFAGVAEGRPDYLVPRQLRERSSQQLGS